MYSLPKSRDYYRAQVKLSKLNYMDLSDALKQSGNLFNQSHESRIFVWDQMHLSNQVIYSIKVMKVGFLYGHIS